MKKLSYLLLVALMSVSVPSTAKELPPIEADNILCKVFGIGCSIVIIKDPEADGDGTGKEPPKQG